MDFDNIYFNSPDFLKNKILHCNSTINIDNESLYDFYTKLLRMRHDLLHYCVLRSMGKQWEPELTVRDKLKLNDDCELLNRTPDIITMDVDKHSYLIDVSISYDKGLYEKIKEKKI